MSFTQSVIDAAVRVARREVAAAGVARAGWGTVTGVSPLAVTLDESSSGAMAVTPVSLVDGLAAGDRVWVEHSIRRAVIVGRTGGQGDTGWLSLPMAAGWTYYSAVQYRRIGNRVHVRGTIRDDSAVITAGTYTSATMPAGYRPGAAQYWPAVAWVSGGTDVFAQTCITTAGELYVIVNGGTTGVRVSLDYLTD